MNAIFETRFARIGETSSHYRGEKITSTKIACRWAKQTLCGYFSEQIQEEFLIATLDTKHRVKRVVRITRGTLDASLVHPREVFSAALADRAAAILLVHNHPSGDPEPSMEDRTVTDRLTECGKILGISVLDHIVVGESEAVSIRETA